MSSADQMAKRTPAQQAKALHVRYPSLRDAQDYVYDRMSNARRQYELQYWKRMLGELPAAFTPPVRGAT